MEKRVRLAAAFAAVLVLVTVLTKVPALAAEEYVTISFEDYGIRLEKDMKDIEPELQEPLGEIFPQTRVKLVAGDTIASVTIRFLEAQGVGHSNAGTVESNFYLASIKSFTAGGTAYGALGEFDAGSGSGWMITLNDWFINQGADAFAVEDGDVIRWQYTCQLGKDIHCDMANPSAKITGLELSEGTLSPAFAEGTAAYTLTVPAGTEGVTVRALLENYWARATITSGGKAYKPQQAIPVENGTEISVVCEYKTNFDDATPADSDTLTITVSTGMKGDVNGDGKITVRDITALRKLVLSGDTPSAAQLAIMDMNGDGAVTVRDITAIRKIILAG